MSSKGEVEDEESKDEGTRREKTVVKEKNEYKSLYLAALKTFLPCSDHFHSKQCIINLKTHSPVFSSITPINEPTQLRFAVGSNHLDIVSQKVTLHKSTVLDIVVPVGFSAIFYHNRTIHGGGSSEKLNIRMFSVHAPSDDLCVVENKNFCNIISSCEDNCKLCSRFYNFKKDLGGENIFPISIKRRQDYKVLQEMNDYNLIDHGFAVVKVSLKAPKAVANQATKIGQEKTKGLKFHPLGQDEVNSMENNRGMLVLGTQLCSDIVMNKFVTSHLDQYLTVCETNICKYLNMYFGGTYATKGKTLLRSKGVIGNQTLHLDGFPDCSCGAISNS